MLYDKFLKNFVEQLYKITHYYTLIIDIKIQSINEINKLFIPH